LTIDTDDAIVVATCGSALALCEVQPRDADRGAQERNPGFSA